MGMWRSVAASPFSKIDSIWWSSPRLRTVDRQTGRCSEASVACHVAGKPDGTHDAHSLRTAVHVPHAVRPRSGLRICPGDVLKDLFVQAQFGDQVRKIDGYL